MDFLDRSVSAKDPSLGASIICTESRFTAAWLVWKTSGGMVSGVYVNRSDKMRCRVSGVKVERVDKMR